VTTRTGSLPSGPGSTVTVGLATEPENRLRVRAQREWVEAAGRAVLKHDVPAAEVTPGGLSLVDSPSIAGKAKLSPVAVAPGQPAPVQCGIERLLGVRGPPPEIHERADRLAVRPAAAARLRLVVEANVDDRAREAVVPGDREDRGRSVVERIRPESAITPSSGQMPSRQRRLPCPARKPTMIRTPALDGPGNLAGTPGRRYKAVQDVPAGTFASSSFRRRWQCGLSEC
jgi:hypothetical protein